jgi:hypothetical protein
VIREELRDAYHRLFSERLIEREYFAVSTLQRNTEQRQWRLETRMEAGDPVVPETHQQRTRKLKPTPSLASNSWNRESKLDSSGCVRKRARSTSFASTWRRWVSDCGRPFISRDSRAAGRRSPAPVAGAAPVFQGSAERGTSRFYFVTETTVADGITRRTRLCR